MEKIQIERTLWLYALLRVVQLLRLLLCPLGSICICSIVTFCRSTLASLYIYFFRRITSSNKYVPVNALFAQHTRRTGSGVITPRH